jgi:hypothetical protein
MLVFDTCLVLHTYFRRASSLTARCFTLLACLLACLPTPTGPEPLPDFNTSVLLIIFNRL